MYKTLIVTLALIAAAVPAEIKKSYPNIEKTSAFQPNLNTQPIDNHAMVKKEAKLETEMHPVYKNEARARIELVKSQKPIVIKSPEMLNDQPASETMSTEVNRVDNVQVPNFGFVPTQVHPEVAYPDIPYAPGFSYDNVYSPSNTYDVYGNGLTNYYPEEPSTFSLIWSQVPDSRAVMTFVGRTIVWIINSAFVLAVGSFITVALCSYTNLCSINFHGVGPIHEEMRSLMTPERLEKISNAAGFVKNAIDKYQKIQQVDESMSRARRSIFG